MTLPISTRERIAFTPADCEGQDGAPVYYVKPASIFERSAWRKAVQAMGAFCPSNDQMLRALRDAIAAVAPDNAAELLELVDQFEAAAAIGDVDEDLGRDMTALETIMSAVPVYAEMRAQRGYYLEIAPLVAAQHFLVGGENTAVEIKRANGKVSDAILSALPEAHVWAIGNKAINLFAVGAAEKNA